MVFSIYCYIHQNILYLWSFQTEVLKKFLYKMMKQILNIIILTIGMMGIGSKAYCLPFTITPTVIQPTCNGSGSNGTISVSITPPSASGCIYKVYKNGVLLVQIDATIANLNSLSPGTYKIVVLNKTTTELDSIDNIVLNPTTNAITVSYIIDSPRCQDPSYKGTITLITAKATPPATYQWSHNALEKDSIADTIIANAKYVFTVTDAANCRVIDSVTVIEKQGKLYAIDTIIKQTSCDSPIGSITISIDGLRKPFWSTWQGIDPSRWDTTSIVNPYTTILDSLGPGFYTCYFYDSFMCYPLIVKDIEIKRFPAPEIDIVGTDSICADKGVAKLSCIVLKGDTNTLGYQWLTSGETASKIETIDTGTYYVVVTDNYGCTDSAFKTVYAYPEARLSLTSDAPNNTIVAGTKTWITLDVDLPYALSDMKNLKWDLSPSLKITSNIKALADPTFTADYRVEANYGPGCYVYKSITINVTDPSLISNEVTVKTILSPNGDGINETFRFSDPTNPNLIVKKITSFEIAIYDRWGSKVYETFESNFEWRGTDASGNLLQNGVYPYVIKYNTVESKFEKIIKSGALFIEK
jgi:gliding motility-associated-like protein